MSLRRAILAGLLLALAIDTWGEVAGSEAANRRCAPVVSPVGPGLTKASVLIVTGRVDCEKARRVIFRALSRSSYEHRQIAGWDCGSTSRGGSGVYGARCATEGEKAEEVIRSTLPRRCRSCRKIRS